ncbi:hypothetical protein EVAR_62992_1 [Eumeta japonica]|uniref:Uncharacterized protein n=1 Tax=Eumeta variegata TaxID=151549 RepID=A0A4C2A9V2_EUMVA|nr:hypothetical protein EVAR_62992_1 [Eumeta japonica]
MAYFLRYQEYGQSHLVLLQLKSPKRMTVSPKARRAQFAPEQPFGRREIDRDNDEHTVTRHSESTTRGFHINKIRNSYWATV